MGKVADRLQKVKSRCEICDKGAVSANNRPHSLHKTKRVVKPNLQKYNGMTICTSCKKTLSKLID